MKDSIKKYRDYLPLIPAVALYFLIADHLDFIQDDAYISFRYAANYLNGHGLVYNIGEQIEGFTNFGWVVYLILWGAIGIDFIVMAKWTGLILGAVSLVLIYLISLRVFSKRNRWLAMLPVYLVAVNYSFAYWSPAGLETAAFTFLSLLSLYLFLKRSWLLIASLALAVWVRPEGALLAIILIVIDLITERKFPRYSITASAAAFVLSLPYLVFKISYYGSILPNPFYAKAGFDIEQLLSGLEYAGRFFKHYGFYGAGFVIPLAFYKKLTKSMKIVWLFSFIYIVYIVAIGGDVLKAHRFFLPLFGPVAVLTALSILFLVQHLKVSFRNLVLFIVSLPLLWLTYRLPNNFVMYYNQTEKSFVSKMTFMATEMSRTDSTVFSVALSTIGKVGYDLLGHDIIDILGLTDSTIARHEEVNIEGLQTTWKERKYNIRYLLERAPDYIVFSTGSKPSAPAEQALFLYPSFFQAYVPIPWSMKSNPAQLMGVPNVAFKRVRPIDKSLATVYDLKYVEYFKVGLEQYLSYDYRASLKHFDTALTFSARPYNPFLLYEIAFCLGKVNQFDSATAILDEMIKNDSLYVFAHRDLYLYSRFVGDSSKANIHRRWLERLVPWYWPEIKAVVDQQAARRSIKR